MMEKRLVSIEDEKDIEYECEFRRGKKAVWK